MAAGRFYLVRLSRMARSSAVTVDQYLAALPEERRLVVTQIRDLILAHLPAGYEEAVNWGMLCYEIPLSRYPTTYNGQPLGYVALASQKNYLALYLMSAYAEPELLAALEKGFAAAGRKLDMGKSCLRFRTCDDLAIDAVATLIAATPPEKFIEIYERNRPARTGKPAKKQ